MLPDLHPMQRGNVLTDYKNICPIELGNTNSKHIKPILRFRKLPRQECTNLYTYVPFSTLLSFLRFVLTDLSFMQSREILTKYKNVFHIVSDYTSIKPCRKNINVFYVSGKINTIQQDSTLFNLFDFNLFDLKDLCFITCSRILIKCRNVHPITLVYINRKGYRKNTGTFAFHK